MESIHVNEVINNHDIVIPFSTLKPLNHQEVDIVIIPKKPIVADSEKNELLELLSKNKRIQPFKKIKDPVAWQRKIRSEW